jgi:[acyl-carrier-protein] S-malonyltransferase
VPIRVHLRLEIIQNIQIMTLAFVFPGQGSQSVGMLNALAEVYPQVQQTFAEASTALGYDLWSIASAGPEEKLNQTEITQPAMLSAGVAVWRVWQAEQGPQPVVMAGHSLGEYTALTCAGAIQFTDAVRLVADRGRFMQEAVPAGQGGMAAIVGLEDEQVRALPPDRWSSPARPRPWRARWRRPRAPVPSWPSSCR